MGKNNRARRSAKQKARQQSNRPNRRGQLDDVLGTPPSLRELVDDGWHQVALASMRDEPIVPVLVVLAELPRRDVDLGAERALMSQVARLWLGGWQPAELVRQTARTVGSSTSRMLVSSAIAADHLGRSPAGLDDRWQQQLDDLRLPELGSRSGWIRRIVDDEPTRRAQLEVIADAIVAICALPRLDTLIPPPGADPSSIWPPGGGTVSPTGPVDPTIERVRNLLAKAESTEFDAEAAAFTAKAQELIVRHAIDRALLAHHAGSDPSDRPVAVRVFVDAPYADAKSFLLQIIADESRCRSVFHAGLDMSTVVGFPSDVEAVQLLFASLLVQAQTALNEAAKSAPPGARPRSQSFRSAFYLAFASRIGDRLAAASQVATEAASAELGSTFLPVLADRRNEVDDLFDRRFDNLSSGRVRGGYDAAGWASGELAADRAALHHGDLTSATQTAPPTTAELGR
jgi:hypothetical protein